VQATCPDKGVALAQDLLCILVPGLALARAAQAAANTMWLKNRKPSVLPKRGYLYSSKDDGGRIHCPDKSDTVFATFSALRAKRGKQAHK
jgi:hypothetical protein